MCYLIHRALCKHARHSADPRRDRRGTRHPFEHVMSPSQGSRVNPSVLVSISSAIKRLMPLGPQRGFFTT